MSRKLLSPEELRAWMNTELRKFEDCEGCRFGGVTPLREPDETGCNWSDSIYINTGGVPPEIYRPAVQRIITEARKQFNLK
jgi:hypothetical protein